MGARAQSEHKVWLFHPVDVSGFHGARKLKAGDERTAGRSQGAARREVMKESEVIWRVER